ADMDEIVELAAAHGVMVIEDNAHGLGGGYRGKPLATMGQLATLSFHETKNFTGGEGGALIVNDPSLLERAEIIREKGTNRSRFFRGLIDKYSWVDVGSSYLPSELVAAHLCAQLEARVTIQQRRSDIWHRYDRGLSSWAAANGVQLPHIPSDRAQAFHMFHMLMPSLAARTELIRLLDERGMLAVFHYLPLHLSAMGVRLGGRVGDCPVTEDVSDRLVRLPFYTGLTELDQDAVIETALSFAS
ncbi:MAG: DegT/DnrJ/EryC1/StrS family aminotransferase, partial [Pseudonocardiaceae bacterium]